MGNASIQTAPYYHVGIKEVPNGAQDYGPSSLYSVPPPSRMAKPRAGRIWSTIARDEARRPPVACSWKH